MVMRIFIKVDDDRPPGVTIRAFRRIAKAAMFAVGVYWDQNYKMLRFDAAGESRYHLQARSPTYLATTARKLRQNVRGISRTALRALTYTGLTRRQVAMPHIPRAFPTRVTITLAVPSYIRKPRKASTIDLAAEMVTVRNDERIWLERVWRTTFEHGLNDPTRA